MKALRYQVNIGKDHQLVLPVPEAEGPIEVIVMVPEGSRSEQTLGAFLRDLALRPRAERSREELDRSIEEERASRD